MAVPQKEGGPNAVFKKALGLAMGATPPLELPVLDAMNDALFFIRAAIRSSKALVGMEFKVDTIGTFVLNRKSVAAGARLDIFDILDVSGSELVTSSNCTNSDVVKLIGSAFGDPNWVPRTMEDMEEEHSCGILLDGGGGTSGIQDEPKNNVRKKKRGGKAHSAKGGKQGGSRGIKKPVVHKPLADYRPGDYVPHLLRISKKASTIFSSTRSDFSK